MRERINLPWGWLETASPRVRIGDRLVPRDITVHLDADAGQPTLDMQLAVIDGIPQCRDLRLSSVDGGREVKAIDLEGIKLGKLTEDLFTIWARRILEEKDGEITAVAADSDADRADAARDIHRARKGKAARTMTPAHLERVAEIYKENFVGAPTKAVAQAFGVQPRTAAQYVKLAREGGFLGSTTRGRKGV